MSNKELKEQYDIIATKMDQDDKIKAEVHRAYIKYGYVSEKLKPILNSYIKDGLKPWRQNPKARKYVLKAAKKALKSKRKKSKSL